MTTARRGRIVTIAAGLAAAGLVAFGLLRWEELAARRHLLRLKGEPGYLGTMLDGLETRAEARALLEFLKTEAGGEALIAGIARRLETTGVRVTDRCFGLVIPVEMEGHERLELYPWLEWRMGPVLIRSGSFALCRWPVSDPLLEPLSGREVSVSDCPGVTFRVLSTEAAVQRFRERGVSIDLDDLPRGRQPYTLVFERRREPVRWIPRWLKKLAGRSEG